MSKNKEKDTLANPFAKLSKMDFPDRDAKKKEKNTRSEPKKQKSTDIPFDDDAHLFLASIGEVNKLSSNKKVHADFSDTDCTMAELLEKSTQKNEKPVKKD